MVEHAADFLRISIEFGVNGWLHVSELACQVKLTLEFSHRATRYLEEAAELSVTLPSATLRNVR
jgi:hypothetical protein